MQPMPHGSLGSHAVIVLANVHVRYYAVAVRLSSVCLSSVTFVHRTLQSVEIFGNVSTSFGTLAIR